MVTAIGKMTTSVLSQFGVCSKKAAIRLSTETGKKLVDESVKLGRNLTNSEVVNIFKDALPKRLRPNIIFSKDKLVDEFYKRGASKDIVDDFCSDPSNFGVALTCGSSKAPMFVNAPKLAQLFGKNNLTTGNSYIAHELEHAIERNNTLKGIFERRILEPFQKLTKKDYKANEEKMNMDNFKFQTELYNLVECSNSEQLAKLSKVIQDFSGNDKVKLNLMKKILNMELPAYRTGTNVEKYGANHYGMAYYSQKIILNVYENAMNILKGKQVC